MRDLLNRAAKQRLLMAVALLLVSLLQSAAAFEHFRVVGNWCREDLQSGFIVCSRHEMWEFLSTQSVDELRPQPQPDERAVKPNTTEESGE